jgi:hypothetical protein
LPRAKYLAGKRARYSPKNLAIPSRQIARRPLAERKTMKDNLFIALSKYQFKKDHSPLENFITEAFAWILRNNRIFFNEFFNTFLGETEGYDQAEISTQEKLDGNFPDMVIKGASQTWIFEHKTFTRLSENQLCKYKKAGQKFFGKVKIVLITGFESQHEQNPDYAFTWCDLYKFIVSFTKNDETFFLQQFAELLLKHGLGPQPALSYEAIISYLPAKDFRENLSNILSKAHQILERSRFIDLFYENVKEEKAGNLRWNGDLSKFWGRIGTEYLKNWRPGVFIGCIVDPTDHCYSYKNKNSGIDLCLIISFDQSEVSGKDCNCFGKIDYEKDQLFHDMVEELSVLCNTSDGYDLYKHFTIEDRNNWHPVYLRKPIAEIFLGTQKQEDQILRVVFETEKLLEILNSCKSFLDLREKYNKIKTS